MSATSGASRRNAELKVEYCGEGDDWVALWLSRGSSSEWSERPGDACIDDRLDGRYRRIT
jgi:hypothetical protein